LHKPNGSDKLNILGAKYVPSFIPDHVCNHVPSQLSLAHTIQIAQKWIASCEKFHPHCHIREFPPLPGRVLNIGKPGEQEKIKLIAGAEIRAKYVALSYRWGQFSSIKTSRDTLEQHLARIAWDSLPKTFQDAISLCWGLGVQYLWIDALCIVQDDIREWEIESSNMASVYANSYLTVAATACPNNESSLFFRRMTSFRDVENTKRFPQDIYTDGIEAKDRGISTGLFIRPNLHLAHRRFRNLENAKIHLSDAPLLTRAWAFQERLLPCRTLHFHREELVLECRIDMRCECGYLDDQRLVVRETTEAMQFDETFPTFPGLSGTLKSLFARASMPDPPLRMLRFAWHDLVSEFSRLDLTYETDRLPALSGLAEKFSRPALGQYLAGIWAKDIATGLGFRSFSQPFNHIPTNRLPKAPTWSWSSIPLHGDNYISYNHLVFSGPFAPCPHLTLLNTKIEIAGLNCFGWVSESVVTLFGRFGDCVISRTVTGGWGLKRKSLRDDISEPTSIFYSDGRMAIEEELEVSFLYLGGKQPAENDAPVVMYSVVLEKSSDTLGMFRRVGLMETKRDPSWLESCESRAVSIM
jgi:hypothetical protein